MKVRIQKSLALLLLACLLVAGAVMAGTEYIDIPVNFNVAGEIKLRATLLDTSTNDSGYSAPETTASLDFNASSGTEANVNPRVVGDSTQQSDGNPIIVFSNQGTVQLNVLVEAISTPACVNMYAGSTWASDLTNNITGQNYTLASSLAVAGTVDSYIQADFETCSVGTLSATIRGWGVNESYAADN